MRGHPFGIFHAPITDESNGPLEITLAVDGLIELSDADGDVRSYRLGGGPVSERFAEGKETDFPEILGLQTRSTPGSPQAVVRQSGRLGRSGTTRP